LVDLAAQNFHLQSNSPCINSGDNASVVTGTDLDGRPRIVARTVDIGAYEFQGTGYNLFIRWLQQYGLATDGSADFTDPDGDGLNNWQEWVSGTDPTNTLSVMRVFDPARDASGLTVSWQSVSDRIYVLERSTNLAAHPPFLALATNIPGQPGMTIFTDTNVFGPGPFFYRVGIYDSSRQLQTPFSVISFAWLQQYEFPTDGSADSADPDSDSLNNWQEWIAGTVPTNAGSVLRISSLTNTLPGLGVSWQSVNTRIYYLQRSTNLGGPQGFSTIKSNIVGQVGTTSYTDVSATNSGPYYYRLGVQ
jgi:hypothetical protein